MQDFCKIAGIIAVALVMVMLFAAMLVESFKRSDSYGNGNCNCSICGISEGNNENQKRVD